MRSVGLDIGAKKIHVCVVEGGCVTERGTAKGLDELARWVGPGTAPARVAFEACREGWHIHDTLLEWKQVPLMLDTTRVRRLGIGQHGRKTDRIDAEVIARAVEDGRLPLAHVLTPDRRDLRTALSTRHVLVDSRTALINTARGLARASGKVIDSCDADHFVVRLEAAPLPVSVRAALAPLTQAIAVVQQQLAEADALLVALAQKDPTVVLMTTTPGVGLIVAATMVSVLDGAGRFHDAHQVESYLGLVPYEDSSGKAVHRLGHITKQGNRHARTALVEAAWVILQRYDREDPLGRWARQLAQRRSDPIAAVALARRLAGVLWAIAKRGVPYDAEHAARTTARGMEAAAARTKRVAEAIRTAGVKARRRECERLNRKKLAESVMPKPARAPRKEARVP